MPDPDNGNAGNGRDLVIPPDKLALLKKSHLSEDAVRTVVNLSVMQARREVFSGPMPHPDHFGKYEEILPGAAERILTMAEKEQSHRHTQSSKLTSTETLNRTLATIFGGLLGVALVGGGIFCVAIGQPVYAVAFLSAPTFGALRWFLQRGAPSPTASKQPEKANQPALKGKKNNNN